MPAASALPMGERFSPGEALASMARGWWRNALPLVAIGLVVNLPAIAIAVTRARARSYGWAVPVISLTVDLAAAIVGMAALTAAGLEALRGQRVRPAQLVVRGAVASWKLLLSWVRAFRLALAIGLVAALGLWAFWFANQGAYSEAVAVVSALFWLGSFVAFLVTAALTWAWVFPLPAVVLEQRRDGIGEVVRRARELTRGRRVGVLALVALLALIFISATVGGLVFRFSDTLPTLEAAAAPGVIVGLVSSFVDLGPAAAYLLLRREKDGPAADQLGLVFE